MLAKFTGGSWVTYTPSSGTLTHSTTSLPLCLHELKEKKKIYIYIYGVEGVWVQLLGSQGVYACVILILSECIWDAPVILLVLPAFDNTGSLGSPPHQVVTHLVPPGMFMR